MPLPVISIAAMRDWEKATWAAGQTEIEVIRGVGKKVAAEAFSLTRPGDPILILAGKGHNGEDARRAREYLVERRVDLLDVTDPVSDRANLEELLSLGPALIIDGLFGVGLNRRLSAEWVAFIERVNQSKRPVLAVDVPSGLNADTGEAEGAAIRALTTLTVGAPKRGLLQASAWPFVGRLEIAREVGLVPCPCAGELQWLVPEDFDAYPPPRLAATHKGSYGHLGIVAGSLGYHGAAVLCARGAQHAQPGLITLHTDQKVYPVIASQLQAVMVSPWTAETQLPGPATALLAGPGLAAPSVSDRLKETVQQLWRQCELPMVVDASALDWIAGVPGRDGAIRVITPHPGEAARMLQAATGAVQADRVGALRGLSRSCGNCWVILKGHQTLIGNGTGDVWVNASGNPYLAQGGSGDVLSGYVAGLITQPALQKDVIRTLACAVWQHGAAADRLQARRRNWVVEDLLDELGNQNVREVRIGS
jgi:ADP-dependent NAD(P)H-hydrate dehydratase / NAD(P)H-hydrate epimerase